MAQCIVKNVLMLLQRIVKVEANPRGVSQAKTARELPSKEVRRLSQLLLNLCFAHAALLKVAIDQDLLIACLSSLLNLLRICSILDLLL